MTYTDTYDPDLHGDNIPPAAQRYMAVWLDHRHRCRADACVVGAMTAPLNYPPAWLAGLIILTLIAAWSIGFGY